ncbi:MAG: dockerin, partial [Acutalibacteraceae bacterium]
MYTGTKKIISILFSVMLIVVSAIPAQASDLSELIKYPEYPEPYLERDYAYSVSVTQGEKTIDIPVYNAARQYDDFRNVPEGDYYRRFCEFAFSGDPVTVNVQVNIDMT